MDDDVGLMGTKLICAAYNDTTATMAEVTSSVTDDFARVGGGKSLGYAWKTLHACPANYFLSSARYLSELFVLDDGTERPLTLPAHGQYKHLYCGSSWRAEC